MKTINRLLVGGAALALLVTLQCNTDGTNGTGNRDMKGGTNSDSGGSNGDGGTGGGDGGTGGGDMAGAPNISLITPALGPSTGNISLILSGTNFKSGAQVYIANQQAAVGTVTPTQITLTLPQKLGTKGKVSVQVLNTDGGSVSNSNLFAYYYGQISFDIPKTAAAGNNPTAVTLVDIDNNMKLDAVVANYNSKTVTVLSGNGDGNFLTPVGTYTTDTKPNAVTVADFDKNGTLDIATTNEASGTISILFNNGSGIFSGLMNYAAGTAPQGLAFGDVNKDTILDIVTANAGDNNVTLLKGAAGGSFGSAMPFTVESNPTSSPSGVVIVDMNNDNKLDLVVGNQLTSSIGVLIGDGAGNFTLKGDYGTGAAQPRGLVVGDFNNDGHPDVAVALNGGQGIHVGVMLGVGDGSLNMYNRYVVGEANGDAPYGLASGDINGDGIPDLVATLNGNTKVSVLISQSGSFPTLQTFFSGNGPKGIALGDLNGDGNLDIVSTNYGDGTISALINKSQ